MSDRIYAATRKGLFTIDRGGNGNGGWHVTRAAFEGDNVVIVARDPRTRRLFAALDHGHFGNKLHASDDDGASWEEITTPAYPEKPADYPDVVLEMSQKAIPWALNLIWAIEPGGRDQPGVLWLGTLPGGLFRSNDNGQTWELVRSLWDHPLRKQWFGGGRDWPGIHSICVDPRDSKRVALGVSCGGVWLTENGGETWNVRAKGMIAEYMPPERQGDEHIQDPHLIVQCHAEPDVLWTQHHNGIWRTTDGCGTWKRIENAKPSHFGFAVAVHPKDPDTAWFVPAIKDEKRIPVDGKVVVSRTRDGGKSFDVLSEGLPQHYAYDLTFRHALDVDETGDRLAFGSTTGSLWVSENQGDAWETVSTHLPPVHCVRFVKP